jgi:phosphate transport system substrate-binding protein
VLVVLTVVAVLAGLVTPGIPAPATGGPSGPITFAGSGTSLGVVRALAEAFTRQRPDVRIDVPASIGSTGAVRAVTEGAIPVGLLARPLRESEKSLGLTLVPYARTAVVLAVHPSVVEDDVTSEELVRIYRAEKTQWKDGRDVIVLTREPGDNHVEVLQERVPRFKEAYEESHRLRRWTVLFTDQDMHRTLERTPSAFGLVGLGSIRAERLAVKPLRFNGIAPTPENVVSGKYPLVIETSFVFKDTGRLPDGARAFIEFVRSRDGEKVIRASGFVPAG